MTLQTPQTRAIGSDDSAGIQYDVAGAPDDVAGAQMMWQALQIS
jgi:hypothetical protein